MGKTLNLGFEEDDSIVPEPEQPSDSSILDSAENLDSEDDESLD